ncbi:MAG: methyltransferase [Pseudomonadales bacterium]|nr:methyltransferase [Pseudomonadales bacterium]
MSRKILLSLVCLFTSLASVNLRAEAAIDAGILQSPDRTPAFVERDVYRHPAETLAFFGLKPDMTVVEIWPGGGWYTEILAPYLEEGKLYAGHFAKNSGTKYFDKSRLRFEEKIEADTELYHSLVMGEFSPKMNKLTVPNGSANAVLTFRNVHNWLSSKSEAEAFALFYKALKPGGVLGVVEHRAKPGTSWETMKQSGYMTEAYVIALAEKAGFVLDAKSEVNANPKDSADHPKGVWTLPPTLRMKDIDREKYLAIGESDRMTLRFKKPALNLGQTTDQ